jgi:hypothetical protein
MGLDVSCVGFGFRAGSYSGFHAWREWLAEESLHIELADMDGFGGATSWAALEKTPYGRGMLVMLTHSDCDGDIGPQDAAVLLDSLREFAELRPKKLKKESVAEWQWDKVNDWIKICEESVETGEPIHFH